MAENPNAFPASWEVENGYGQRFAEVQLGMTLRDWFAGQALAGSWPAPINNNFTTPAAAARAAYKIADAMLAEREKSNG